MIDFLYFEGCPNAGKTWNNLESLVQEGLIKPETVSRIEVPDMESAEKHHFQGSPTILINGIDIYSGVRPEGVHYACRVFTFDGERTGVIPKEFIRRKIDELVNQ
jgi:diketogulonate reductase-like aldo/keto reductase